MYPRARLLLREVSRRLSQDRGIGLVLPDTSRCLCASKQIAWHGVCAVSCLTSRAAGLGAPLKQIESYRSGKGAPEGRSGRVEHRAAVRSGEVAAPQSMFWGIRAPQSTFWGIRAPHRLYA